MTAAAFTIFWMKVKLEKHSLLFCSTGAAAGMIFGEKYFQIKQVQKFLTVYCASSVIFSNAFLGAKSPLEHACLSK